MDLRLLRYFVAVAEERHFGRAAARLHMTQPPLSRAIKQLEADLGTVLLHRSSTGVTLTAGGTLLYDEARTLLEQAERARARVAAAGSATITIGTLGDSVEEAGTRLAAAFRQQNPGVRVRIRETDFTDPTAGLRAGLADIALTRMPFDRTGIITYVLRSDPIGVVLRADDPLAGRDLLHLCDLADRQWLQLPEGTDPVWRAYWNGTTPGSELRDGPVVRTVSECMQAVLWNGTVGVAPLAHALPEGLICIPLADMPPSRLVLAWNSASADPLIRSFTRIAAASYRSTAAAK
jgi:DNA-binding transcriptional LysR family regulator